CKNEFWGGLNLKPPLSTQEQGILAQLAFQRASWLSLAGARNLQTPAGFLWPSELDMTTFSILDF
ncbi:hypothetical protein A2U01_0070880, partial [Trifolium medium]|nr:hypothetical protein [Trifolium medium]